MENNSTQLIAISEDMASALRLLQLADAGESVQEEAADEERKILRWLSNLPSVDMALDEWFDAGAPEEAIARAASLSQLIRLYIRKLKRARRRRPEIMREDVAVEDAFHAAAAMTQAVAEHTLSTLPDHHPQITKLEALIVSLPAQADMRQTQSVKRLVETLETGMDRTSGKNISGKSPAERLVEMSGRIETTVRTLRSIDSLEPPAREESIELAREILRRLKNMSFSDRPMKEMVDTGQPEDKAAFAQKIDEMADLYKNLLQEAAVINPNILQDQRIRDANDAVATFSHAVKLMAAKEMPTSAAAAQQISAAEGKEMEDLHRRLAERLESIERGVNAAKELLDEQQEQQQNEDLAQEAADNALSDTTRRKKKRKRRGGSRSGSGGKKQHKEKMAHEADDYVLKQGRFGRDAKTARGENPAAMPGLNAEALAAVRQLGGTLLNVGNQAKDIGATLATVSATDKIAPDDKTVSQRVIEEQQKNPRNQGPRV